MKNKVGKKTWVEKKNKTCLTERLNRVIGWKTTSWKNMRKHYLEYKSSLKIDLKGDVDEKERKIHNFYG